MFWDAAGRTFLYILYVATVRLAPNMAHLKGTEVVCRWYIDSDNTCSSPFALSDSEASAPPPYFAFVVISTDAAGSRARGVTMTLSPESGADHLAVAFLDLENFSPDDQFKTDTVSLETEAWGGLGPESVAGLGVKGLPTWSNTVEMGRVWK